MANVVKQMAVKQSDGTYQMKDIGVDYTNVDGLATAATAFKALSADEATGDKNGKDITEYIADVAKDEENIALTDGDGNTNNVDLSMTGATGAADGEAGFVPKPLTTDNGKFLKGDGTWDDPQDTTYDGSSNIDIDGSNNIDLTATGVTAGSYGPTADQSGSNISIVVPMFTVDAKGRLTSAGYKTMVPKDTQYGVSGTGLSLTGTNFSLGDHASTVTGFGGGTASKYGHNKLSDVFDNNAPVVGTNGAAKSVGASAYALEAGYKALKHNIVEYRDITADFNSGTFSANPANYSPGNYIVKAYGGVTYAAVLCHYNYRYNPGSSDYGNINVNHWTAIVMGFAAGQWNTSNTTANGVIGSAMMTWLKGACQTAVLGAFGGTSHVIPWNCYTSKGSYNANAAPNYGFAGDWTGSIYAMIPTEEQIYGTRVAGFEGWGMCTTENRPLKLFQERSFMEVLGRNYGQSNNNFNSNHAWLSNIASSLPVTSFCRASFSGYASDIGASKSFGRFPLINLK
jgi:hypothetical protein